VYWNSRLRLFSVLRRGRVVARRARVVLRDVSPVVRAGGWERWRTTGHRTVFAFLDGATGLISVGHVPKVGDAVRFCHLTGRFIWTDGSPFESAAWAVLTVAAGRPAVWAGPR